MYSIVEIQPSQYLPGVDTAGSKGGLVVNRYSTLDAEHPQHVGGRSHGRRDRADSDQSGRRGGAVQFQRGAGRRRDAAEQSAGRPSPPPPPIRRCLPPPPALPVRRIPAVGRRRTIALPQIVMQPMFGGAGGPGGYTWHLSVIDAGQPRQRRLAATSSPSTRRISYLRSGLLDRRRPGPVAVDPGRRERRADQEAPLRHARRNPRHRRLGRQRHDEGRRVPRRPVVPRPQRQRRLGRGRPVGQAGQEGRPAGHRRLERRRQDRHRHLRPGVDRRPEGGGGRAGPARRAESARQEPAEERPARPGRRRRRLADA